MIAMRQRTLLSPRNERRTEGSLPIIPSADCVRSVGESNVLRPHHDANAFKLVKSAWAYSLV